MVAQLHVTVPADCVQLPLAKGVVADTNVEFAGIVLVRTAFVAWDVLLFANWTRNWTSPVPSVIGSGDTVMLEMPRSICELTMTALLALLLIVFGSLSVPATLDESVRAPPAVGVTMIVA